MKITDSNLSKQNTSSGVCKIHNVRFYNLTPRSINYLAYNVRTARLAVSRTDASIEIWNMQHAGYLEKTVLGLPQSSVEALGWAVGDRLLSTGHSGEIIEWDLQLMQPRQRVMLTGNAAWCLAVSPSGDRVAVGTEEGYLNLFSVNDDGLTYAKIFDKQEGRIMCCRFDRSGQHLVTGSVDCLRIWDVNTGHAIHRMAAGRSEANRETIVWSLAVLSDLTVIAGDSRGRITIWDGKMGTQRESFAALKADVLSIAVNEDETVFCCSGIDPIIKMYVLTAVRRDQNVVHTWIKYIQRSVHDHDIKALTFGAGGRVYSGGIDGYLGVSVSAKSSKQQLLKYAPFLPQPCAVVAPEQRLLLLKYFDYLEVWRLGRPGNAVQLCDEDDVDVRSIATEQYLSLERSPEKLVELRAYRDMPVVSASVSPDGRWLAYTSETYIRLFALRVPNDDDAETVTAVQLQRIRSVPAEFTAALHVWFARDSKSLFTAKRCGRIEEFVLRVDELDDGCVELRSTIETRKYVRGTITSVTVSLCGLYLVVVGTCATIAVFKAIRSEWRHYLNLPKYRLVPTAVALHVNRPLLVAAFSDSKIFEYHLEDMRFTCSSHRSHVDNEDTHAVNNIVLDPDNENVIMLHNDTFLYVLEKTSTVEQTTPICKNPKSIRSSADNDAHPVADLRLKFKKRFEHFVHLSRLSNAGELVAVGVNPVTLIEQLPPSMRQKKFGAA